MFLWIISMIVALNSVTGAVDKIMCEDMDRERLCYYLVTDLQTWQDANNTCVRNLGGSLLTINSKDVQDKIEANLNSDIRPWIGAKLVTYDQYQWTDNTALGTFFRWDCNNGYPKNNSYVFASKAVGYMWRDDPSDGIGIMSYICEVATCSCVDTGQYISIPTDGRCFYAYKPGYLAITWFEANKTCLSEFSGLLAKIDTDAVFNDIQSALISNAGEFPDTLRGFWIGLHREQWMWASDGSSLEYDKWEAQYPTSNGGCAHLRYISYESDNCPEYLWNNDHCMSLRESICEQTTTITNTAPPDIETLCEDVESERLCYYLVTDLQTWQDANNTCVRNLSGSLLTINSKNVQDKIEANLDIDIRPWIGGKLVTYDQYQWTDNTVLGSFSWWDGDNGYPKNNSYVYASKSAGYMWRDDPSCGLGITSYICEVPTESGSGVHTGQYVSIPTDGRRYYAYMSGSHEITWFEANRTCVSELSGFLAKIDTETVFNAIRSALIANAGEFPDGLRGFWIGLHRGQWAWSSDGSSLEYDKWEAQYPTNNGDCAHMKYLSCGPENCPEYTWNNDHCTSLHESICERKTNITSTAPLNIGSSTNYQFLLSVVVLSIQPFESLHK